MEIGRVGIWTTSLEAIPPAAGGDVAAELEAQGWSALWFGEAYGREAFTQAQLLLAATSTMVIGTSIANIWGRDAVTANAAARTLTAVSGDRFALGLGVSHQPIVQRLRGHDYAKPLAAMREFLTGMDAAPSTAVEGQAPRTFRVLAALAPGMLKLSAELADGAIPYLGTPAHTAIARELIGPGKFLGVEQAVVLTSDPEVAMRRAHAHLDIYTGLPNYRNNWERLGFTPEVDFVRGGSDRLAEALVVWGSLDTIRAKVQEHFDAGADHVCVQVLREHPFEVPSEEFAELAPALVTL
jgi:probable F420-dependent oxidoreductase